MSCHFWAKTCVDCSVPAQSVNTPARGKSLGVHEARLLVFPNFHGSTVSDRPVSACGMSQQCQAPESVRSAGILVTFCCGNGTFWDDWSPHRSAPGGSYALEICHGWSQVLLGLGDMGVSGFCGLVRDGRLRHEQIVLGKEWS